MLLDLHCHTEHSFDSKSPVPRVLAAARRRGLDALAITDHDTIDGALEALRIADGRLLIIVGEEITTDAGDIIGLFLKEAVKTRNALDAIAHVRDQGGIAVLPHPFSKTLSINEEVARRLHACEGFNARYAQIPRVREGMGEERIVRFAREYNLTLVASSDAHVPRDVGRGRTSIPATTLEEAREGLLKGSTMLHGERPGPAERQWRRLCEGLAGILNPIPEAALWPKPSDSTPANS